jgi:hypothetical protein
MDEKIEKQDEHVDTCVRLFCRGARRLLRRADSVNDERTHQYTAIHMPTTTISCLNSSVTVPTLGSVLRKKSRRLSVKTTR